MDKEPANNLNNSPETESDYAFLRETVKQRPLSTRDIVCRVLAIAAAAVLFGGVSGLVFNAVTRERPAETQSVSIPRDETDDTSSDLSAEESPDTSSEAAPEPTETPLPTPPLTPEEKNAEALAADKQFYTAMRSAADKVRHSVVTVTGLASTEDWFRQETIVSRTVSGVIVADNGQSLLILAERRVLDGAESISVAFSDGTIADAAPVKSDPAIGLTILSVARESLPDALAASAVPAELGNSFSLLLGDAVIAVGSPIGTTGSFAAGHITSLSSPVSLVDGAISLITTDITGASTGSGILLDTDGEVVGFISQQYAPGGTEIVTAIPISLVKTTIELLSNGSPIPYLGIEGQDISRAVAEKTGLPVGVYVTNVLPDSPAFAAGVQPGDIISFIDEKNVLSLRVLHERLMILSPNQETSLTVLRNGADGYVEIPLTVRIGELS